MCWDNKQRQAVSQLEVHDLHRMNGSNGERSRLLVFVVKLMEVLVKESCVIKTVENISDVVLRKKK